MLLGTAWNITQDYEEAIGTWLASSSKYAMDDTISFNQSTYEVRYILMLLSELYIWTMTKSLNLYVMKI